MDEQLLALIKKYNQGKCTPAEKQRLEDWYNATGMDNSEVPPPPGGWEAAGKVMWKEIRANQPARKARIRPIYWQVAAAAVILLAIAGLYRFWQQQQQWIVIRTAQGEIRQITLPDSSSVTMNGNAVLRYGRQWDPSKERQVWITGEAFFNVRHLHKKGATVIPVHRFLVHAGPTQVTVLGTSFNVKTQGDITRIILETGHIQLNHEKGHNSPVDMLPGEMVTVNIHNTTVKKEKINTTIYTAWKAGKLELNSTDFADIVKFITYNYGRKVGVYDTTLLHKRLSGGTVDTNDEQQLYSILSTILNVNIRQQGDSIIISHQ
ncbi:FecR domain-containing protein [Chitinophaga pendula]|uniref:FecR family protein n=1 Tax=Chitinophaga TaxID=79328 RepID=UPI000BB05AE6|nr:MULTISPECIES: FecR domain-containing protein [Chitinophaga]ASZ13857.1 hypothetical protein CK934_24330 [Chitinophaga sp. MD30]UCJ08520.1 FecR domain-containing protein [Chitinophaga pendula]